MTWGIKAFLTVYFRLTSSVQQAIFLFSKSYLFKKIIKTKFTTKSCLSREIFRDDKLFIKRKNSRNLAVW